jgi:hypothetical protein
MADDDWYNRAARRRRHGSHSPASSCSSSTASAITHAGSSNFATTENYGIVAQFYQREIIIGRRFERRMDPTRTPREMAIQWAEQERIPIDTSAAGPG